MEKSLSDALKKRVDTRCDTLLMFQTLLESCNGKNPALPNLENNRLFILTNFGHITCELFPVDDDQKSGFELLFEQALEARDTQYEELPEDTPVISNCKTVTLKNVTVTPFANPSTTLSYETLILFTDQIVGITIGQNTSK